MRTRLLTVTAAGSGAMLALSGCALLHSSSPAAASAPATDVAAAVSTSARPSSYSPLSGPVVAASALPRTCSAMLTQAQLQNVFGAGVGAGTKYASYAALPDIDRTGRVACIFGVGLDSFGRQSDGAVEIAIATYGSAADAVRRAADTAQQDAANGATAAQISVGGHPATLIVEPQTVSAPTTAAASPSAVTAPASASAIPSASAAATATASASGGETELVLADGNRTFVLQIPFGELSSTQAATVLTQLALFAYQNTLPAAGSPVKQSPSTG